MTDQTENQETVIEFRFKTDHIDMSNAGVYRADIDQIQQVLDNRKKQGLHVTKFANTHIVGDVSITDDSNYMITKGNHKIEFFFRQKGVILGALLSMISITYLIIQLRREKDENSSY